MENWTKFNECGLYRSRGIIRSDKRGLHIVVNEKTQSEITITVPIQNEAMLAPYLDKPVTSIVQLEKLKHGSTVNATVTKIDIRIPHPLTPNDTGVEFISKGACK